MYMMVLGMLFHWVCEPCTCYENLRDHDASCLFIHSSVFSHTLQHLKEPDVFESSSSRLVVLLLSLKVTRPY